MKYLVLIMAIALAGCCDHKQQAQATVPEKQNPVVRGSAELRVYEDLERGVTCYRVYGYQGLSCLKTKPSLKEQVEEAQIREILGIKEEK